MIPATPFTGAVRCRSALRPPTVCTQYNYLPCLLYLYSKTLGCYSLSTLHPSWEPIPTVARITGRPGRDSAALGTLVGTSWHALHHPSILRHQGSRADGLQHCQPGALESRWAAKGPPALVAWEVIFGLVANSVD